MNDPEPTAAPHPGYPEDCRQALHAMIDALRPARLLLVAPQGLELRSDLAEWPTAPPTEIMEPDAVVAAPPGPHRFEAAVVADTLEHISKARGAALIARLRDVYTQRLLVLTAVMDATGEDPEGWTQRELMALGLRMIGPCVHAGRTRGLFLFDIFDYKTTPEWLNPRHWANPQMWNKRRW